MGMTVDEQLARLAVASERLQGDATELDQALVQIDGLLQRLMFGLEYVHPRPLQEHTRYDVDGKRIIELSHLAHLLVDGRFRLVVKTMKVLERRAAAERETPGRTCLLLDAPQTLRFAAIDQLPELIAGLAAQVDELAGTMQRRRRSAGELLEQLRAVSGASAGAPEPQDLRNTQPVARPTRMQGSASGYAPRKTEPACRRGE